MVLGLPLAVQTLVVRSFSLGSDSRVLAVGLLPLIRIPLRQDPPSHRGFPARHPPSGRALAKKICGSVLTVM